MKKAKPRAAEIPPEPEQPTREGFPVVGIGASAGGLAAFEAFFSGMPAESDPGMAFVIVQHLAPDHKSILSELVRRYTRMQVFEVEDGITVHPNCAYIIPPNRDMAFLNGSLELMDPVAPHGQRLPIDFFFKSLAQDQHGKAICVVLSGTGHDGTQGLRAIKAEGGMAMAQEPGSTEYDGMPRSAIETGLVDFVLPPAEMPARLIAYAERAIGAEAHMIADDEPKQDNALKKVFILLRAQTGHDFSQYKRNTIHRRIERRMAVQRIGSLEEYVKFLQTAPPEVDALFRDLLIGVTSFFRDPEAFAALQSVAVPALLSGKKPGDAVRVWVPGCSTGEEAYSLAIVIAEGLKSKGDGLRVQVFATDIDAQAIAAARAGLYPGSIAAEVGPARLSEFFTAEPEGAAGVPLSYRIKKSVRDMLVFSEQDVIKDPPFSKLDLISCRNLLIYMGSDLQKKVIPLFHYALAPGGSLFLGTSETVGDFLDLFDVLDRKAKLYRRKERADQGAGRVQGLAARAVPDADSRVPSRAAAPPASAAIPLRETAERAILKELDPAAALVGPTGDILYLHGRTGAFLEPASGEACVGNVLKMAREGLRYPLTQALQNAVSGQETVRRLGVAVKGEGRDLRLDLTVKPIPAGGAAGSRPPMFLMLFKEAPMSAGPRGKTAPRDSAEHSDTGGPRHTGEDADTRILALKEELNAKEANLQAANEELETSNEELKSLNEEMQSANEELQSTNEELETSKEELQSINEELSTVNTELQTKVTDLSRANNDMVNLLAGTGIGTVFVDHELRIQRFTPAATRIINLIPSDVGRPVGHLVSNLVDYPDLVADVRSVLATLIPVENEARTQSGAWYTVRVMPYRTLDNVIEGAVLTFVDITDMKHARRVIEESELKFRTLAESLPQLVWTASPDGLVDYLGPQWPALTGIPAEGLRGVLWLDAVHPDDRAAAGSAWDSSVRTGDPLRIECRLRRHDGAYLPFQCRATALRGKDGSIVKWFGLNMERSGAKPAEGTYE